MSFNKNMKRAFSEIWVILHALDDEELISKLPSKFIELVRNERDIEYTPMLDPEKPLEEQEILEETINILAMLKYVYWCETDAEKAEFQNLLDENERKYQEELKKKYNVDNIF